MIQGLSPTLQALLGTLFTWGVTAAGAAVVVLEPFLPGNHQLLLDGCLGFAGGVMIAASFWSLLAPAIEMAESDPLYQTPIAYKPDGSPVTLVWFPVAVGFGAGGAFLILGDKLIGKYLAQHQKKGEPCSPTTVDEAVVRGPSTSSRAAAVNRKNAVQPSESTFEDGDANVEAEGDAAVQLAQGTASWRRTLLLVLAITLHNIPEGLAVGVGFSAVGTCKGCTFSEAVNLAVGIGIQNFPEGLAVSLPLRRQGMGLWTCFFYGQLSGMVEPLAGVFGALAVSLVQPLLPYAMAFAAGAMIFVVVDDLIPEAQLHNNGRVASVGCVVGFIVMMMLDVALG